MALLLIFIAALSLRIWGISFGLPYDFTPDEIHEILRALKLGAGEYSWSSGKGGLYLILFVEYGLLFVFWSLTGRVDGAMDFALSYLQDPTAFYLLGRLTVAVMGALTCLVIYGIGRRAYGTRTGVIAAAVGASAYYHAMWSHYINVDIGMTLAMWASILAYMRYEVDRRLLWLIVSGGLAGVAVAFKIPGGIALLVVLVSILSSPLAQSGIRRKLKEAGILAAAMVATVAVVAPENIVAVGGVTRNFSKILDSETTVEATVDSEDAIDEITIMANGGYLPILLRDHNVLLMALVVVGLLAGLWRRNRWDIIWAGSLGLFLIVMTLADRPGMERYLLPVMPIFWLLAARGIAWVGNRRPAVTVVASIVVIAPSLYALVEQNYEWTRPDTRILAKNWIEQNVRPDSKILMDGMRFRFIHSPPLTPNSAAVSRRVEGVREEDGKVSRGVSDRTLQLYAEAMRQRKGPKFDLYSTVYGLEVRSLDYYPDACFDYVVTSSGVTKRFEREDSAGEHPLSEEFYRSLPQDPRYLLVYSAEPVPWQIQGPAISVYKVLSSCG